MHASWLVQLRLALVATPLALAGCAETAPLSAMAQAPTQAAPSAPLTLGVEPKGSVSHPAPIVEAVAPTAAPAELSDTEACLLAERSHDIPTAYAKLSAQCKILDRAAPPESHAPVAEQDDDSQGRPNAAGAVQLCAMARRARMMNAATAPILEARCRAAGGSSLGVQSSAPGSAVVVPPARPQTPKTPGVNDRF